MTKIFSTVNQPENGTKYAAGIIRSGGLVAFPTETVYGLGANGLDGEAVRRIFEAKGRPQDNPLILHVARKNDVRELWTSVPEKARLLMDAFWPGPLTLIFNKSSAVPDEVTCGLDTVAVRMSENKTALCLIRAAGCPIAAPSANLSGKPSPTTAQHVIDDLWGKVDVILDGGPCRFGVESTVLLLTGTPTILRPGAVTKEMIEAVIGETKLSKSILAPLGDGEKAASPGMKYKHYAPEAEVLIAEGSAKIAAGIIRREYDSLQNEGKRCIILTSEENYTFYKGRQYDIIGSRRDERTLCAGLFAKLREYSEKVDVILTEATPTDGYGLAYMNRLLRAAGFRTLSE